MHMNHGLEVFLKTKSDKHLNKPNSAWRDFNISSDAENSQAQQRGTVIIQPSRKPPDSSKGRKHAGAIWRELKQT